MDKGDILESLADRWQRILRKRLERSEELSSELVEDIIACALDQLRLIQPHGAEPMTALWLLRQLQWTEIVYELVQGAAEELLSGNSLPQPALESGEAASPVSEFARRPGGKKGCGT